MVMSWKDVCVVSLEACERAGGVGRRAEQGHGVHAGFGRNVKRMVTESASTLAARTWRVCVMAALRRSLN